MFLIESDNSYCDILQKKMEQNDLSVELSITKKKEIRAQDLREKAKMDVSDGIGDFEGTLQRLTGSSADIGTEKMCLPREGDKHNPNVFQMNSKENKVHTAFKYIM